MSDGWSWSDGLKLAAGIVFPPYGAYQAAEFILDEATEMVAEWQYGDGAGALLARLEDDTELSTALQALQGDGGGSLADAAGDLHEIDEGIFDKLNMLAETEGFSGFLAGITSNETLLATLSGGEEMTAQQQVDLINALSAIRGEDPNFFERAQTFIQNYGDVMTADTIAAFGLSGDGNTSPLEVLKSAVNDPLLSNPDNVEAITGLATALAENPALRENLETLLGAEEGQGFNLTELAAFVAASDDNGFLNDLNTLVNNEAFAPAVAAVANNPALMGMMRGEGEGAGLDPEAIARFVQGLEDRVAANPDYLTTLTEIITEAGPAIAANAGALEGGADADPLAMVDQLIASGGTENIGQLVAINAALAEHPGLAENLSRLMGSTGNGEFELENLQQYLEQDPEFLNNLQTVVGAEGFELLVDDLVGNQAVMALLSSVEGGMPADEVTHLINGLAERVTADDQYFTRAHDFISNHENLVTQAARQAAGEDGDGMDMLAALDMGMESREQFAVIASSLEGLFPADSEMGGMIQGFIGQIFELFAQFMPMINRVMGAFDGIVNSVTSQISGNGNETPEGPGTDPDAEVEVANNGGGTPTLGG